MRNPYISFAKPFSINYYYYFARIFHLRKTHKKVQVKFGVTLSNITRPNNFFFELII